jgi:hypothetical protein
MQPTIGRIVRYTLTDEDCGRANILSGNFSSPGDVVPLIITWCSDGDINGQAFMDAQVILHVTLIPEGEGPGTWAWPART